MPSNHLILFCLLFLLPLIFPSIGVFSNESAFRIRWPKYQSFSFNISPSNDSRLISFRMDWLDLPAVQGTLKSLLQHHSSKASVLLHSAFFIVQFSHPHMTTGKTLMVFYRLGPGGTGIKKKERERAISPGSHGKPIKPIHRTCTTHEGTGHPLKEVLKARARK